MFFSRNDRDQIKKILTAAESNRVQLHHFSSDINDSVRLLKRLESVIEQLTNDFETLKARFMSLEAKLKAPRPKDKPKAKKAS